MHRSSTVNIKTVVRVSNKQRISIVEKFLFFFLGMETASKWACAAEWNRRSRANQSEAAYEEEQHQDRERKIDFQAYQTKDQCHDCDRMAEFQASHIIGQQEEERP